MKANELAKSIRLLADWLDEQGDASMHSPSFPLIAHYYDDADKFRTFVRRMGTCDKQIHDPLTS